VAPTVRDGALEDAFQEAEVVKEDGPQHDFVDSLAEWNDQGTGEEQRDAGLEDALRIDRVEVGMQPDASPMDRPEDRQDTHDAYRGDAGVFMMGVVRSISAKDDLTCVVPASGEVYCWGSSPTFFPGIPIEDQYQPRRMAGYRSIVSTGQRNSAICAIDEEGAVWCSGYSASDALALGLDAGDLIRTAGRRLDVQNAVHLAWQLSGLVLLVVRTDGTLYARVQRIK